jgi:uncharacterized protein YbjT (DUF2867 family)
MIFFAGGTGRLGSLVVTSLATRGLEVRVLTRDPARAQHLVGVASQVVVGDVRDPVSLASAVQGVDIVVSAVQGFAGPGRVTPATVDRDGNANLVDAAAAVGADVVLLSVVGASADSPMELFRAKHAAEEHLRASGTGWTIVRATAFLELWAQIMARPIVFGHGDNPINFVSVADVAVVVERVVIDTTFRGQVVEVGGPPDLTFNELATMLQDIRGAGGKVRHVPRSVLRAVAPFARQARAAVAMDTTDMTFDATLTRAAFGDLPMTDVRTGLTRTEHEPQPRA